METSAPSPVGFLGHLAVVVEAVQHVVQDAASEEYAVDVFLLAVGDGKLADAEATLHDAEETLNVFARALQPLGEDQVAVVHRVLGRGDESFPLPAENSQKKERTQGGEGLGVVGTKIL